MADLVCAQTKRRSALMTRIWACGAPEPASSMAKQYSRWECGTQRASPARGRPGGTPPSPPSPWPRAPQGPRGR
eukprot:15482994-Alexandrium_andersonii.AAC.1